MKRRNLSAAVILAICLVFTNICFLPETVSAKEIVSAAQVKKLAKQKVKGAKVVEIDRDEDKGQLVYDVELSKGKKEYNLVYRASDSKLISYEWEIKSRYVKRGTGKLISASKAKKKAKKQVSGAEITSVVKKRSSGIDVYKVKMNKGSKKYEMKIHARTGAVLEYEWDLIVQKAGKNTKASQRNGNGAKVVDGAYIGEESAKQIALEKVGGGTVVKLKLDEEDRQMVYEVEIVKGEFEYEFEIDAVTGEILKYEKESIYD